jgi:cytochrome c oxidase assembly protein subunit 15
LLLAAAGLVTVSYIQLVFGAQLRHVQPGAAPGGFAMMVALHVITAFFLWFLAAATWMGLRRCGVLTLSRPAACLIGLVGAQILLGVGTWVVNYGWPSFLRWVPGATGYLLQSKGFVDSIIVTAHVAIGALILAVSTLVLVRLLRVRDRRLQARLLHRSVPPDSAPTIQPATTN